MKKKKMAVKVLKMKMVIVIWVVVLVKKSFAVWLVRILDPDSLHHSLLMSHQQWTEYCWWFRKVLETR